MRLFKTTWINQTEDIIKAIQENGAEFISQFEDGSTVIMQLADPGASVAMRDKENKVEYLS